MKKYEITLNPTQENWFLGMELLFLHINLLAEAAEIENHLKLCQPEPAAIIHPQPAAYKAATITEPSIVYRHNCIQLNDTSKYQAETLVPGNGKDVFSRSIL